MRYCLRTPRLLLRLSTFAVAFSLALAQGPALAQSDADKATARELGLEGLQALERRDYKTAEDRFRRAEQLYKAPTLSLGLARAYAGNGRYVAAQETYNRIIREGAPPGSQPAFVKAVEDAKAEVGAISAKIGYAVISVTGAENPTVTVDDQPLSNAALGVKRPIDPGAHVVRATAEGYKPAEARFTVPEAGTATASLAMEKDPNAAVAAAPAPEVTSPGHAAPPVSADAGTSGGSANKTLGFVALGVGGVGLVAGAITGVLAMGKHGDLEKECPNGSCPLDKEDDVDSYETMGTISTVGFIVGGVGVAAGVVLLVTAPSKGSQTARVDRRPLVALPERPAPSRGFISPYVGPLVAGATGRF